MGWKSPEQRAQSFGLAYGQWLRQQGCSIPDCRRWPVELHHVIPKRSTPLEHGRAIARWAPLGLPPELLGSDGKPDPRKCQIPLCKWHHENADLEAFWRELGVNPIDLAVANVNRGEELGLLGQIQKCARCSKLRQSGFDLIEILNRDQHEGWLCEDCAPPGPR